MWPPTRQYCLVLSVFTVWTELATGNFETVLSSLVMRCELSLVLSWPSFHFAAWLPIVTSYLETGSRLVHKCVHTADKTGQVQYIENYLRLSRAQFTSPTRQDGQSCRCWRCELAISMDWRSWRGYDAICHSICSFCLSRWSKIFFLALHSQLCPRKAELPNLNS